MSRQRKDMNTQSGFTLLEVMIAMSIFLIGILGIVGLQYRVVHNNTKGLIITQGNLLAQSKMEELKNTTDISNLVVGGPYVDPDNPIDEQGNAGGSFTRTWTIAFDPTIGSDYRLISVTVARNAGLARHSVTISSLTVGEGI